MPVLSTNPGRFDEDRVKAAIIRFFESLGKNEKSLWEHYNEMAAVEDYIRGDEWRDLADTVLVFDGLFAAFLSAFLVFTIPQLQPNSADIAMDVLIHISQQLSNSTTPAYTPTEFTVSPSIAAVNVLFFLSLALVLIDAFLAMLMKSWLQEFDRGWRKYTVANLRAKERERRLQGLERWKLAELVALLPILIQASLLLFCIGLLVLLFPIHLISAIFSSVALLAGLTFYVFTTCVSIFDSYAPFSSPVSRGFIILTNALKTTWTAFARNIKGLISRVLSYSPHPVSSREHELTPNRSTHPLTGWGEVALLPLDRDNKAVKKQEAVTRSQTQIDYQTYASILERLITTTPEVVENIPVFLDLLDQPVKDLALLPSNVDKWKELLCMTLGLLGDLSTFPDSATCTIARTLMFCYDRIDPAAQEMFQRLQYHFDHIRQGQTDKNKPLIFLLASHFRCYLYSWDTFEFQLTLRSTIASLQPSNAADMELFWMVNTFHGSMPKRPSWPFFCHHALRLFTAVLTYVSSTEQSRRSQVPLTASVIYAMHTIKAALETGNVEFIEKRYLLPGIIITTSESTFENFHEEIAWDLWSDDCVQAASAVLQPHTHWSRLELDAHDIWKFQVALIAALYIDSTKAPTHTSTALRQLLQSTNIPDITEATWDWASVYNKAKLVGYWYMALFQEPIYEIDSPINHIAYVITRIIDHCSELMLSALHLLDISVRQLCIIAPASTLNLPSQTRGHVVALTTPNGKYYIDRPSNHWILLHLDTLFPHSSLLHASELEQLEWVDTPEHVHIAKARIACYNFLQEAEHNKVKQLKPEPHLLKLFVQSHNYDICTIAFKWCLHLATVDHPSSAGGIHSTGMFTPEVLGCQWIEHLCQVLCSDSKMIRSWRFLAEHLAPKWDKLPPSWCSEFAFVFLFSKVHMHYWGYNDEPAYRHIARALIHQGREEQCNQAFLPFLGVMLEPIKHHLNWNQLTSLETWIAELPNKFMNQDAYVKLENILATQRPHIEEEILELFAELPMNYPNDVL